MTEHDKEFFYKYASAETAKAILTNCSVRWSSPRVFNDPFDIQSDLQLPYTVEEFTEAVEKRIVDHLDNGQKGQFNANSPPISSFNLLRDKEPRMTQDELFREFRPAIMQRYETAMASLPNINKASKKLRSNLSVFCVSETRNSLLMWSHYSDSHTGAVLKFKCLPERSTALCAARQVAYQQKMPVWATLDQWVDDFFDTEPRDNRQFMNAVTATKSKEWHYEKEWRAITKCRTPEEISRGYVDRPILPEEIVEVTLGCRMSATDTAEIAELSALHYPHATLSQASIHPNRFELEFCAAEQE